MSISSGLWLFGFVLIIWKQRKARAKRQAYSSQLAGSTPAPALRLPMQSLPLKKS
jgi:hypothetical protein